METKSPGKRKSDKKKHPVTGSSDQYSGGREIGDIVFWKCPQSI